MDSEERDPREMPCYGITEAAQYLSIPVSTLRAWTVGQNYRTSEGAKIVFRPVIKLPDPEQNLLSFINLVEVHVLDAIRRSHKVPLPKVRDGLDYLKQEFPSRHPLVDYEFETNGMDLFVEKYGQLINISRAGQLAMKALLEAHLRRIDRDPRGIPIKLYPFTRKRESKDPKWVAIDPYVSFGRPILTGTGIAAIVIVERYKAGESIEELVEDYGRSALEIQEAIRILLPAVAA